ncbi:tetratricopeptide repeat protein [bacterium]|nr:tetratricopeptide repeat protein [bacterium]
MKFRIDLAWVVLFGPLLIVVSVLVFEHTPWVKDQTSKGAHYEASIHVNLGRSAMKRGNYEEASGQYKTALMIDPDYPEAYMGLGIIFNIWGNYDRAIAAMKKAIELDTMSIDRGYNNLGMVYASKKDYDTALKMFGKALLLDSTSVEVYRNIGEIATVKKNWEKAVHAYYKAIENKPNLKKLYWLMSQAAILKSKDEDDYKEIEEFFNRDISDELLAEFDAQIVDELAQKEPKLADDYMNLAKAYMKLDNIDEAITSYERALKITPNDAVLRNRLGITYARSGDLEKAHTQFTEAVRLDPGYEDARFNLQHCESKLQLK